MPIRWDPILVRHTAQSLAREFTGAHVRALRFDGAGRDLVMLMKGRTLVWRLHPSRGYPLLLPEAARAASDLVHRARIRGIDAIPDERVVRIQLLPRRGGPAHDLFVELLGNQWNARVVEVGAEVVRHVLWSRDTGLGHRVGERYMAPPTTKRMGVDGALSLGEWMAVLADIAPEERARTLVSKIAWTSPLVASHLLAIDMEGADEEARFRTGFERWQVLARGEAPEHAVLLRTPRGPQPYPFPLTSHEWSEVRDLMAGFEAVALGDAASGAPPAPLLEPGLERRLADAVDRARRKVAVLEEQQAGLGAPEEARSRGDLILARYGDIPTGATEVTLEGFDGSPVHITLDPTAPPHENARRHYDEAARIERALDRLPKMILDARVEAERLDALLARARRAAATADEVTSVLPALAPVQERGEAPQTRPYRVYHSSGKLEIRVGRGARYNDELTFRHSAPGDIWLHARHAAGAHVILRWQGPGNPPARDLEEAATLAALHSRARTSGSVPVDWTFRKYVRKPRGAARGAVVPERVRTIFVRPDPDLERALAADAGSGAPG